MPCRHESPESVQLPLCLDLQDALDIPSASLNAQENPRNGGLYRSELLQIGG
jgi:hypothetical protein